MDINDDKAGKHWLIAAVLILAAAVVLFYFDRRISQGAQALIPSAYAGIPTLITNRGLYLFYAVFAGLLAIALVCKDRRLKRLCLAYLSAQLVVTLAAVRLLKIVIGRARPGNSPEFNFFSPDFNHNSFPSGHAADAFVSGMFLYYLLKHSEFGNWRFLPLLYAFLIAASRVFVGAHYPSDVAAGAATGIIGAWLFITRLPHDPQQSSRL